MTSKTMKAWEPNKILLSKSDINASIALACKNGKPFAPSPVTAALIAYDAILRMMYP